MNEANILSWADCHISPLSAIYTPGVVNWQASCLSHQCLHPEIFLMLSQKWGTSTVDMVASRFNKTLDRFIGRSRNPMAFAVEARVVNWSQLRLVYACTPEKILP